MVKYSDSPAAVYYTGVTVATNTPHTSGGAVDSWAVSPTLPGGLILSAVDGTIIGTPIAAVAEADYVLTATNVAGSSSFTLAITVHAGVCMICSTL